MNYQSEKTKDSRKKLYSLFMQTPAPICVLTGPELVYELVNPLYEKLMNSRPLLGRPVKEALPELEGQGIYEVVEKVYTTGKAFVAEDLNLKMSADGIAPAEDVYINLIFEPLREENNQIEGIICIGHIVTSQVLARKNLHEYNLQLSIKNEELRKINKDLDGFIYAASHDLMRPVSNFEGLINALKDSIINEHERLGPETGIMLGMLEQSVNQFKKTIDDLTRISKVQKSEAEDIGDVDCLVLIDEVKAALTPLIRMSEATVTVDFNTGNHVRFSRKNLTEIIYNLLSNALKYRHPLRTPEINIAFDETGGMKRLSVTDNGLGISESNLPKVFTMFKRFHGHVEGAGVGLYMVKRIVDNAGGKVEVESEEGKGTSFRIYFPGK